MNAITRSAAWREKSRLRRIVAFVRSNSGALVAMVGILALMALGAHITGERL